MRGRAANHSTPSPLAARTPRVGALVPGVLARLGLAEGLERWRAVVEWEAIVGESLARHSWARRVDGQTLVVETDDPFGLSHAKPGLLKLVRDHLGSDCIKDLRLETKRN
jgi:hypothetical protein